MAKTLLGTNFAVASDFPKEIVVKRKLLVVIILGDPGADIQGERQIKRAKSMRAEAWCERKFTRPAEEPLGTCP